MIFSIALIIILAITAGLFFIARFVYIQYFKNKTEMETSKKKITQSLTFKGITIVFLTLILLIPGNIIQDLITERQDRSINTIQKINDKWSNAQTLCAPLLVIPYTTTRLDADNKTFYEEHTFHITPKELNINTILTPEERHYGIYKAILYKSNIHFEGSFSGLAGLNIENSKIHFEKAQIVIGVTDLRGITQNPDFKINGKVFETTVGNARLFSVLGGDEVVLSSRSYYHETTDNVSVKTLVVNMQNTNWNDSLQFECTLQLNGSRSINFIPVGQNTSVTVNGQWVSPSFTGSFSPESNIDAKQFTANWSILSFNREIPKTWSDYNVPELHQSSFGVSLIETNDHYQQNMRSAKYALMFIVLTFIVFFFAEIFTKKSIQFFQYVLVGISLVLFYTLLLSLSEQTGFGLAYLIASASTILLITIYFYSLIKQKTITLILAGVMFVLYAILYIILQIEDFALLFGSIFLFLTLCVIMFASNKIKSKI